MVTVAEITTSIRGLAVEVPIDRVDVGLDRESVVNCDGIHTVAQASLTSLVGAVGDEIMHRVGAGVNYGLGC